MALADNGHTASFAGLRSRRYNRVELRLAPIAAGFYVLRAKERDANLSGAQLVAIDGRPIDEIRAVAQTLAVARLRGVTGSQNFLFDQKAAAVGEFGADRPAGANDHCGTNPSG